MKSLLWCLLLPFRLFAAIYYMIRSIGKKYPPYDPHDTMWGFSAEQRRIALEYEACLLEERVARGKPRHDA